MYNSFTKDGGDVNQSLPTFTTPVSENQLVEALTEHAQKIAESILSQPDAGRDLAKDAKVRMTENRLLS